MKKIFSIFSILFLALIPAVTLAASGIIDTNANYAWSSNLGWINFAPLDESKKYEGLQITDDAILGNAWSQNLGWLRFDLKNGGVKNTNGRLSGQAFGENIGWVDFSNVKINCDGKFTGKATGTTMGTLNFDCQNCQVKTSWRALVCNQENHLECSEAQQCVTVLGEGSNQCQVDTDCKNVPPPIPQNPQPENPANPANPVTDAANLVERGIVMATQAWNGVKAMVNTPLGSLVTKAISTTSLAGGALAATMIALSSNISLLDILLFPLRILGVVMTAMGLKKRSLPWGVVYDSVTKQPLDPAYVILKDLAGQDVASAVTDLDGRYGFLVAPGTYQIVANKTNYRFPSEKLAGQFRDETYGNLYFGAPLDVQKAGEVITKNIPLDPVKFDWNEFAKRSRSFMKFYSRWDHFLRQLTDMFFIIGFGMAIVAFIFAPYPYNTIIFVLYLVVLLLRILGLKPKAFGYIVDQVTGDPLSFALVRIMMPSTNTEIAHRVADQYGRYYCLIPKGKYFVKIERKNPDASYTLVYTSPVIDASRTGIIKKKFLV